jgi:hypothetical protein
VKSRQNTFIWRKRLNNLFWDIQWSWIVCILTIQSLRWHIVLLFWLEYGHVSGQIVTADHFTGTMSNITQTPNWIVCDACHYILTSAIFQIGMISIRLSVRNNFVSA